MIWDKIAMKYVIQIRQPSKLDNILRQVYFVKKNPINDFNAIFQLKFEELSWAAYY